jgi:hypothetical protein
MKKSMNVLELTFLGEVKKRRKKKREKERKRLPNTLLSFRSKSIVWDVKEYKLID